MESHLLATSIYNSNLNEPPPLFKLNIVFDNTVSVILALAGIVVFIVLLTGGWKYLTSGGDPKAAEAAKHTITYGIIGLVVIASSYLILRFISAITGVNVLEFNIFGHN